MERIGQSLIVSLGAIWLNRGRSLLTMLGIIIGIAAVVAIVSLGRGVETFIIGEFQSLGSDIFTVSSRQPESETRTRIEPLTMHEMRLIGNRPTVLDTGAEYQVPGQVFIVDDETFVASAKGITTNVPEINSWELTVGSMINEEQIANLDRVAVVGSEIIANLFTDEDPIDVLGQSIRTGNQVFEIIGVLEPGGTGIGDVDNSVVIPISTAQQRLTDARVGGSERVTTIFVQSTSTEETATTELEIHRVLQAEHGISLPDERDYRINSQAALVETISQITGILTTFLAAIASISLLVGGIGIMNIMLVTVTERTREIGLRKAVGARPADIMIQFLFESLLLSLAGGIIGILLAILLTNTISSLIPNLAVGVQIDAILLATGIASAVGITFGLLPAQQAARLNPIDALRYE